VHPLSTSAAQRICARRRRGARRQHIVHQQDPERDAGDGCDERPGHGGATFGRRSLRLWRRRNRAPDQRKERRVEPSSRSRGERLRLVIPAFGQTPPSERDPGDRVDRRWWPRRQHRRCERVGHRPPPRELQPQDRRSGRPREQERRARRIDDVRGAIPTCRRGAGPRSSAPFAPRGLQRHQRAAAVVAERPGSRGTSCAPTGEEGVQGEIEQQRRLRHGTGHLSRGTVSPGADTPGGEV
jgi:hypothetical protein